MREMKTYQAKSPKASSEWELTIEIPSNLLEEAQRIARTPSSELSRTYDVDYEDACFEIVFDAAMPGHKIKGLISYFLSDVPEAHPKFYAEAVDSKAKKFYFVDDGDDYAIEAGGHIVMECEESDDCLTLKICEHN